MAHLDPDGKEIVAKIVYYGPEKSGKTTCLDYLLEKYRHRVDSDGVMIKSVEDRPLVFDFLPLDVGRIRGYDVKIRFYTVPGGEKYRSTRAAVLKGVDGVVFVADSMSVRREINIKCFGELEAHLAAMDRRPGSVPVVFQYNKRDLEGTGVPILPVETMRRDLNPGGKSPSFPTSGVTGENVVAAMKQGIVFTVTRLHASMSGQAPAGESFNGGEVLKGGK